MKKCMALLLSMSLLLGGCGLEKDDASEPSGTETAPPVTQHLTVATETQEATEDYAPDVSTLVIDGLRETVTLSSGDQCAFAAPQILLAGEDAEDWNEDVLDYVESMILPLQGNGFGSFLGADYEAWTANGYLTVVETVLGREKEIRDQTAAVFRLKDGRRVGNEELLSDYAGAEAVSYGYQLLSKTVARFYDETYSAQSGEPDFGKQKMSTLNSRNLFASQLFVKEDGSLSALVRIYAPEKKTMYAEIPFAEFAFAEPVWKAQEEKADELVRDYRKEEIKYTDDVGNDYDFTMTIPEILIDSSDAQLCNDYLKETLGFHVDETVDAMENGNSSMIRSIEYEAWIWNRTLTVYVMCATDYGYTAYDVYNFDLDTGVLLNNRSVAEKLGISWENCLDCMESTAEDEFERLFGSAPEDAFKEMTEERNVWEANLREMVLFPGRDGAPQLLTRVYGLAGAESYWYVLPLVD